METNILKMITSLKVTVYRLLDHPIDLMAPTLHNHALIEHLSERTLPNVIGVQIKAIRSVNDILTCQEVLQTPHEFSCPRSLAGLEFNHSKILYLQRHRLVFYHNEIKTADVFQLHFGEDK